MSTAQRLLTRLRDDRALGFGKEGALSVGVFIGSVNRAPKALPRRYVVFRHGEPWLNVKFIPRGWCFSVDDIQNTIRAYSRLKSVRVPRSIGSFADEDGHFFIDEYLGVPRSLEDLLACGAVTVDCAARLIQDVLEGVWAQSQKATSQFVCSEKHFWSEVLRAFVPSGDDAEDLIQEVGALFDRNAALLRAVWSSGDIMDSNFILSGSDWYLVDYEFSHRTSLIFKESYRTFIYRDWARDEHLRWLRPGLSGFSEPVAALLSLAWEHHLTSLVLDELGRRDMERRLRLLASGVLGERWPKPGAGAKGAEGAEGLNDRQHQESSARRLEIGRRMDRVGRRLVGGIGSNIRKLFSK